MKIVTLLLAGHNYDGFYFTNLVSESAIFDKLDKESVLG